MGLKCIASLAFWFALTSAASGQQYREIRPSQGPPRTTAKNTTVRSYPVGNEAGVRVVRTRTVSGSREVVEEVFQVSGTDGGFNTTTKTTTETVGIGSDSVKVKQEAFRNDGQGRFELIGTTDTDQQSFPDGRSRTITNHWVPDLNGHVDLSYRQVEEMNPATSDLRETRTSLYVPGINEAIKETERVLQTEQRFGPDRLLIESHRDVRDGNGRWQTEATRNREVRTIGPAEVVEEETTRLLDADGRLSLSERTVTHRSRSNDSDQVVTEVYSPYILGMAREPGSPLALNQRVRITTTPIMNGGSQTITETEASAPGVANGPIKVITRTVETVRQIGPDLWEARRETFALDGSGRLVLTIDEKEETKGK